MLPTEPLISFHLITLSNMLTPTYLPYIMYIPRMLYLNTNPYYLQIKTFTFVFAKTTGVFFHFTSFQQIDPTVNFTRCAFHVNIPQPTFKSVNFALCQHYSSFTQRAGDGLQSLLNSSKLEACESRIGWNASAGGHQGELCLLLSVSGSDQPNSFSPA